MAKFYNKIIINKRDIAIFMMSAHAHARTDCVVSRCHVCSRVIAKKLIIYNDFLHIIRTSGICEGFGVSVLSRWEGMGLFPGGSVVWRSLAASA